MEFVQPLREKNCIEKVKNILLKNGYRDYLLFVAGINTGLRISDLLKLRVSDVKDKSHIEFRETKTGKNKRFYISPTLKTCFDNYTSSMTSSEFLFQSRKGINKPITRVQAYKIINDAVKSTGLCDKIGTHTLRKTFGYWHYQQFKDIAVLQDIFNHSAPSVTLRYIGINDDMKDKTIAEFAL
ncbi:MAG: site-specific integrase [bacterium]